jgi:glycosyltransferase involved in cell wall biosynthesis
MKGHGKEYVQNFVDNLSPNFEINLYIGNTENEITYNYKGLNVINLPIDLTKANLSNFRKYGPFSSYLRALAKQWLSLKYYKLIINSNQIDKSDKVFIMDYDVLPLYYLINSLEKIKVDTYLWVHSAKFKSKDSLYTAYKAFFKRIFKRKIEPFVKKVILNGEFIKEEIINNLELAEEKIQVIQYPSHISVAAMLKTDARAKLGLSRDENIVLFFGLLRKDKNIELLIKSVANCESNPKLIIAGDEASVSKEELIGWVKKYNLNNYKFEIRYLTEEDISLYYSAADLLVLTYHFESASQSGPLALAREFELPVVVSNVGEIGHYVRSNAVGFTASIADPNSFTKRIDEFFEMEDSKRLDLEKNIKVVQEKFSWNKAAEKYINLFSN